MLKRVRKPYTHFRGRIHGAGFLLFTLASSLFDPLNPNPGKTFSRAEFPLDPRSNRDGKYHLVRSFECPFAYCATARHCDFRARPVFVPVFPVVELIEKLEGFRLNNRRVTLMYSRYVRCGFPGQIAV